MIETPERRGVRACACWCLCGNSSLGFIRAPHEIAKPKQ